VVWFNARDDRPKIQLAVSDDDGATFNEPVLVAEGSTNGRVGIDIMRSGDIAVSWVETKGSEATLKLALYGPTGQMIKVVSVAETSASRRSGFPIIVSSGRDVYATWTSLSETSQVKVARIRF